MDPHAACGSLRYWSGPSAVDRRVTQRWPALLTPVSVLSRCCRSGASRTGGHGPASSFAKGASVRESEHRVA